MNGIILIDKPVNLSSFDVIRILKKKLKIDKIGHAGTLDPFASGLLVILVGKATRLSDFLIQEDKHYDTVFSFGKHTSTYDVTGEVLKENDTVPRLDSIQASLRNMANYDQEPPMYSAIKIDGKKLYELARQDIEVFREKRNVFIYKSDIIHYHYPELFLTLHVSKGTYIRSIAVDLADTLHTYAFVKSLRRTQSGMFTIQNASQLEDVTLKNVISLDILFNEYPKIVVSDFIASKILQGLTLDHRQYDKPNMFVVCNEKGDMIALYKPFGMGQFKPVIVI